MTSVISRRAPVEQFDHTLASRFWAKARIGTIGMCWPWGACTEHQGYGRFGVAPGDIRNAHRVAYELALGPIPIGLEIDHLCRNRRCVNPAHLEPVTTRENLLRGTGASARNARKTHCLHGHPLSGDNLLINVRGDRVCRRCAYLRNRECDARRAARQEMAA